MFNTNTSEGTKSPPVKSNHRFNLPRGQGSLPPHNRRPLTLRNGERSFSNLLCYGPAPNDKNRMQELQQQQSGLSRRCPQNRACPSKLIWCELDEGFSFLLTIVLLMLPLVTTYPNPGVSKLLRAPPVLPHGRSGSFENLVFVPRSNRWKFSRTKITKSQ